MDKKDIYKNVYEDFFGLGNIEKRNEKLAQDIQKFSNYDEYMENIKNNQPTIDIDNTKEKEERQTVKMLSIDEKNNIIKEIFEKIDNLYIDSKSKELLKKVIEYMKDYREGKVYISFNMCIYSDNKETISKITQILLDASSLFSYIKDGQAAMYSVYDIEEISQIEQMYNTINSIVLVKDFEAISSRDDSFKDRFMNKLDELSTKNEKRVLTILTANNKERLTEVFKKNEETLRKFTDFEITGINPDIQDVYNDITEKLKGNIQLTSEMRVQLLDYISATFPNNTYPYPEYKNNLYENILFNKQVPKYEKDKTMEEIFAELNDLVGLEKVKNMLKDLVNLIDLKNKTKDELNIKNINLHMVFLGNPGTGKTTVARIVAEILYNLKYIKQNKLIEVSSKDLVAEYVGQTAPKTMNTVMRALGGVLFIDEAYSLASGDGQGNAFNEEAIATLIQCMENYRDNLVVIFAGYTKEMQDFLNANSGIVSRIGYQLEFDDYTTEELIQIFKQMMEKSGFTVEKEALEKVREFTESYRYTKNFGNARFIRNIYEKSIVKHATNTQNTKSKKVLKTISAKDISDANLIKM